MPLLLFSYLVTFTIDLVTYSTRGYVELMRQLYLYEAYVCVHAPPIHTPTCMKDKETR